jgi:hypothetical protein
MYYSVGWGATEVSTCNGSTPKRTTNIAGDGMQANRRF